MYCTHIWDLKKSQFYNYWMHCNVCIVQILQVYWKIRIQEELSRDRMNSEYQLYSISDGSGTFLKLGFSGIRNQPKNGLFQTIYAKFLTRLAGEFSMWGACTPLRKIIKYARKFWQKIKKTNVQLALKTYFSMALPKPETQVGLGYPIHHYSTVNLKTSTTKVDLLCV